jgi:hypothetical protein
LIKKETFLQVSSQFLTVHILARLGFIKTLDVFFMDAFLMTVVSLLMISFKWRFADVFDRCVCFVHECFFAKIPQICHFDFLGQSAFRQ